MNRTTSTNNTNWMPNQSIAIERTAQTNSACISYANESEGELMDLLNDLCCEISLTPEEEHAEIEAKIEAIEKELRTRRGEDTPQVVTPLTQRNIQASTSPNQPQTERNPRFVGFTSRELGDKINELATFLKTFPDHKDGEDIKKDIAAMKAERAFRQQQWDSGQLPKRPRIQKQVQPKPRKIQSSQGATTTAQSSSTLYAIIAIMLACMATAALYMMQAKNA